MKGELAQHLGAVLAGAARGARELLGMGVRRQVVKSSTV
jgi:hypothetical protein